VSDTPPGEKETPTVSTLTPDLTPNWDAWMTTARGELDALTAAIAAERWDFVECSLEGLYARLDETDWSGRSPWSGPPPAEAP
jgi:hypothetical protein